MMARWLVQLEGDRLDLEALSLCFPDGDLHVLKEEGRVYLVGPGLESLTDASQVREVACRTLEEFTGIASLLDPQFQRPAVGHIIRERNSGGRQGFISVAAKVAVRSRVSAVGNCVRGTDRGSNEAKLLLVASRTDTHLREAVSLWADQPKTWPRLYRIYDEIVKHLGTPPEKAGLCSRNESTRFRRSANEPAVAGKDARHAQNGNPPPGRPMDLSEGADFVRRILLTLLRRTAKITDT